MALIFSLFGKHQKISNVPLNFAATIDNQRQLIEYNSILKESKKRSGESKDERMLGIQMG